MTQRSRYLAIQIVTFLRVPGALVAIPFVTNDLWAVALLIYGFCEMTDWLDGYLARRFRQVSRFGKLFDPYCDSVYRLCVFFTLAMVGIFPYWVVWVMALRDVTVSYGRMAAIAHGQIISARMSGKIKAIVQATASLVAVAMRAIPILDDAAIGTITSALAIIVVVITSWSLVDYGLAVIGAIRAPSESQT